MKLAVVFILIFAIGVVALGLATGTAKQLYEARAFNKQKQAYLARHPQHSGSEPIVWTCECGHTDNNHTKTGCKVLVGKVNSCACFLTPHQVRERL